MAPEQFVTREIGITMVSVEMFSHQKRNASSLDMCVFFEALENTSILSNLFCQAWCFSDLLPSHNHTFMPHLYYWSKRFKH